MLHLYTKLAACEHSIVAVTTYTTYITFGYKSGHGFQLCTMNCIIRKGYQCCTSLQAYRCMFDQSTIQYTCIYGQHLRHSFASFNVLVHQGDGNTRTTTALYTVVKVYATSVIQGQCLGVQLGFCNLIWSSFLFILQGEERKARLII